MLKLQFFGHLRRRTDSLEKTLILGKIDGKSRRWQQRMRWFDIIIDSVNMNLSKLCEIVDRDICRVIACVVSKNGTQLSN